MQDKQEKTEQNIVQDSQDEKQEDEDLQFNNHSTHSSTFVLWICLILIIVTIIAASLKIAYILQRQTIIVSNEFEQYEYLPLSEQSLKNAPILNSIDRVLDVLQQNYRQIKLEDVDQQEIINVQILNLYHVQYSKTLRRIDYQNAKLRLSSILKSQISEQSDINYKQFLNALRLLQLTTFPFLDPTSSTHQLLNYEYQEYSQRWAFKSKQQSICAIMPLTKKGLNSGNYYYAIRSLFQQKYSNYKAVIIDNTPALGLQANIVGLLKQVGQNKAIILDKVSGDGHQGSAIFYAINKYCANSEITIILRDTGQLIGSYAFALLNQAHKKKQALVVTSHYLLDTQSVITNLDGDFRYRVQLYRQYKNSSNPKKEPYKAKYIKSYKTKVLTTLPQSIFHSNDGFWYQSQFQAKIQFAALQRACGKFYILDEILYRLPKSSLQKEQNVREAQRGTTLKCMKQLTFKSVMYEQEAELPQLKEFDKNLLSIKQIEVLRNQDLVEINRNFNINNNKRVREIKNEIDFIQQKIKLKREIKPNNFTSQQPTLIESLVVFKSMLIGYRTELLEFNSTNISKTAMEQLQTNSELQQQKNQQNLQTQSISYCILLNTQNNQQDFSFFYTLQSILKQKYSSYRLIIIDNASKDRTLKLLKLYYMRLGKNQNKKIRVVGLKQRKKKGELLYFAVRKYCQSHEFLISMQAGQQLIGANALSTLNIQYQKSSYLAVHAGNFYYSPPSYKFNELRTYQQSTLKQINFRMQQLIFSPLRSFRVDLFLRIEETDFKRQGQWLDNVVDFNICYAILEMTCQKLRYINKVLYRVSKSLKLYPIEVQNQMYPVNPPPIDMTNQQRNSMIKPLDQARTIQPSEPLESRNDKKQASQNMQNLVQKNNNQKILSIPPIPAFKPRYSCLIETSLSINP